MTVDRDEISEADLTEGFISQVMESQRSLYAFILSFTQVLSDADDVLQEVNLVLWRKRAEFQPGTNFQAWSFRVAKLQVLAWQTRQTRQRVRFSDTLCDRLADLASERTGELDERRTALSGCVEQLRDADRLLLRWRYGEGLSTAQISELDGRTRDGIYYALSRIHANLKECVRRRLKADDR